LWHLAAIKRLFKGISHFAGLGAIKDLWHFGCVCVIHSRLTINRFSEMLHTAARQEVFRPAPDTGLRRNSKARGSDKDVIYSRL
jgi:hypothetical protein